MSKGTRAVGRHNRRHLPFWELLENRRLLAASPTHLELSLDAGAYTVTRRSDGLQVIEAGDLAASGTPAGPALPAKLLHIALPADADLSSVRFNVTGAASRTVPGRYEIAPMRLVTADGTVPVTDALSRGRDMRIYTTDRLRDKVVVKFLGVQEMGAWKMADVWYSPFAYNPARGELQVADHVTFSLDYALGGAVAAPGAVTHEQAQEVVYNYDQASAWYESIQPAAGALADYLILTTSAIQSGSTQLANFVAHKQSRGLTVQVVTESQWGGGTGDVAANRMRAWLASNYGPLGSKYVLLIGDPDPGTGTVPMKMTWPRSSATDGYTQSPTDYFYSDLTSDWNLDGDLKYGEWTEDFSSRPTPDVMVGRIPFYGSLPDLDKILAKTIGYESQVDINWRKNMLLPMAVSNYANEDGNGAAYVNGSELANYIKNDLGTPNGYSAWKMFETAGRVPVTGGDQALTEANLVSRWANNPYGIVDWWAHGSAQTAARKVWTTDDGDNVPESFEMSWYDLIKSSDAASLNDSRPSIVVQVSCENGWPEDPNNLGYSLLKNGAIGTYSSSRVSWYGVPGQGSAGWDPSSSSLGDNASFAYYATQQLAQSANPASTGAALNWLRLNLGSGFGAETWMNFTDCNLYGDPAITIDAHQLASGADLVGDQLTFANNYLGSGTVNASFAVKNQGNLAAGAFNTRFYLSSDATIDPATDRLLTLDPSDVAYVASRPSDYRISSLNWSTSYSASVKLVVPVADPFNTGGEYYIGMVVDSANEVNEPFTNAETNNRNLGDGLDRAAVSYRTMVYTQPLDSNPGWTLGTGWQFGAPQGHGGATFGNPDPTSGHTGSNVYGVNLAGDYTVPMGWSYLKTTAINCSGYTSLQLSFWRWLNSDIVPFADAKVEYSVNNTNWTTLWTSPSTDEGTQDASWTYCQYSLGAMADRASTLYIRWGYQTIDGAFPFSGWNIDDVTLKGIPVAASPAPASVTLATASDTGVSSTDKLTKLDNASAANRLTFNVSGTLAGALVKVYSDGVLIGSATAAGTTTAVLTNGSYDLADGSHQITAKQTVSGAPESVASPAVAVTVDTVAPLQQSFTINTGGVQRSMITLLGIVFGEKVTISGGLVLQTRTGATVADVALGITNPLVDRRSYEVRFTGSAVAGDSLPDGMYRLVAQSSGIMDDAGNYLPASVLNNFCRLFGDADGDRDVDRTDLDLFHAAMNRSTKYSTYWYFDYYKDGAINNADLLQMKQRMNRLKL